MTAPGAVEQAELTAPQRRVMSILLDRATGAGGQCWLVDRPAGTSALVTETPVGDFQRRTTVTGETLATLDGLAYILYGGHRDRLPFVDEDHKLVDDGASGMATRVFITQKGLAAARQLTAQPRHRR